VARVGGGWGISLVGRIDGPRVVGGADRGHGRVKIWKTWQIVWVHDFSFDSVWIVFDFTF
jgi:hypothetical protein